MCYVEKSIELVDSKERLWVVAALKPEKEKIEEVREYCEKENIGHYEVDCANGEDLKKMVEEIKRKVEGMGEKPKVVTDSKTLN